MTYLRTRDGTVVGEREADCNDGVVKPSDSDVGSTAMLVSSGLTHTSIEANLPRIKSRACTNWLAGAAFSGSCDGQVGVVEGRVRETEAELEARDDVSGVEITVVNEDTFGKVGLREVSIDAAWNIWVVHCAIIGFIARDSVRQLAGRVCLAVKECNECAS